jgi:hypothetical protein
MVGEAFGIGVYEYMSLIPRIFRDTVLVRNELDLDSFGATSPR